MIPDDFIFSGLNSPEKDTYSSPKVSFVKIGNLNDYCIRVDFSNVGINVEIAVDNGMGFSKWRVPERVITFAKGTGIKFRDKITLIESKETVV